jgi:NAD(P)-dependent dehydrogenase (short-subunit alcohol dehydrogenase family)
MGAAVARRLADDGYRVVVNDRHEARARATAADLETGGAGAECCVADVSTRAGAERLVGAALSRWGRLDSMVNVAGGVKGPLRRPLLEITDEEWDRTLEVNLRSAFLCTQVAARTMINQGGGSIVNIGSTSWSGSPDRAHYAAAKAGLVALTRSAATQLGPSGIRVNIVVPGATLTSVVGRPDSFDDTEDWSAHNPLGRPNTPEDIADAVAFLSSVRARNISGQILTVAGGLNPSL